MRIVAIDQGTTSTRALVVDTRSGEADVVCRVRHKQYYPASGWVEHDGNELLASIETCLAAAGPVDAIGLANQGESCLAWDAITKEPLSPVIVWQDNRTASAVAGLSTDAMAPHAMERSGLPFDAYFSASKFAWMLEKLDGVRVARDARRLRLGTTDAFFLDRLTGVFATDPTTASRTSLMNLANGRWDDDLCSFFGVPIECLPEIRQTIGDFGRIGSSPVAVSIVDQQAALYGHGCRRPGDAKITFGTGAFALTVTGHQIVRGHEQGLLPTVAWACGGQTTYAVDGGVYDAGSAVEWAMRIGLVDDPRQLDAFDAPPAIDRGLVFVPALSGLASPYWDRSAAALWLGISGDTTKVDMHQALVEGIALRTAEVVEAINAKVPIGDTIPIDGGLSQSRYFAQFLANVLDRKILRNDFSERTAFGTAALVARGMDIELAEVPMQVDAFIPDHANKAERLIRFRDAVRRSRDWRHEATWPGRDR